MRLCDDDTPHSWLRSAPYGRGAESSAFFGRFNHKFGRVLLGYIRCTCWSGGHVRSVGSIWTNHYRFQLGLWVHCYYRSILGAFAPHRNFACGIVDGAYLHWRRTCTINAGPAWGIHPIVSGDAAVVPIGNRYLYQLSHSHRGGKMMDLLGINPVLLIASLMVSATPILLAAIGETVVEKSGVLNLGVEGMMIVGAVVGFITAVNTANPAIGFVTAAIAGALLSTIFATLVLYLKSNQVATGLGLTLVSLGISALLGKPYEGIKSPTLQSLDIPILSDIPIIGHMLFSHDAMVYVSILIVGLVWYTLKYTRVGLVLRAVGENHDAAHALGYKVIHIRFLAIMFGGACSGLGGAYISLVRVPQWTEGMTAGAGWIALAIVVFASWKPWRLLLGAYLFGGVTVLQLNLQAAGVSIPVEYLSMSPYLITIIVLVVMSAHRNKAALNAPAALGRAFHASR